MHDSKELAAQAYDKRAQSHANGTWVWAIIAVVVFITFGWWGLIPAALGIGEAVQSVNATKTAISIRNGANTDHYH